MNGIVVAVGYSAHINTGGFAERLLHEESTVSERKGQPGV